ncbi:MAG: DegT/DnrJ/EryC1/StrS family aminotransferase [Thermoleophilaceae bacterium]
MAVSDSLAINGGPMAVEQERHRQWPEVLAEDREAVNRVLDRGLFSGANAPEITALQQEYANYLGVRYCLALNSGTAALHCCAAAVGLMPGDEVIVPAYTFVASAMAVLHQGAVPLFCDIDPRTYNLDPKRVDERIGERTRAILAVHIHGAPADMDELSEIAQRHGLAVIEDMAQSHGIRYRGQMTGTIGTCAGTSLNQSKNLSAGEGGLFVTDDEQAYLTARRLSVFGEDLVPLEQRDFWSHGVGWNYRNQELSSAFARAQLSRVDRYNETAELNASILSEGLAEVRGLTPPHVPEDRGCSYWKYMVQVEPEELGFSGDVRELRDRILHALRAEGAEAMVWQPQPLPAQPAFRRKLRPWHPADADEPLRPWDPQEYSVASDLCDRSLALGTEARPLYLQDRDLMLRYLEAAQKVVDNIDEVLVADYPRRRYMVDEPVGARGSA